MAITQSNQGSILDHASKVLPNQDLEKTPQTEPVKTAKAKSNNIFASTLQELKLVQWPSLGYVIKWSIIIIVFTGVLSLFIYNVDRIFKGATDFFVCTANDTEVSTCFNLYGEYLTYQREIN